jgi:hypothetical protein
MEDQCINHQFQYIPNIVCDFIKRNGMQFTKIKVECKLQIEMTKDHKIIRSCAWINNCKNRASKTHFKGLVMFIAKKKKKKKKKNLCE